MGLDLRPTLEQLDALAQRVSDGREEWTNRLHRAIESMRGADASEVKQKVASSQGRPFLCAGPVDGLAGRYEPQELPVDFCVASVDGSHIDIDRHIPLRCYLINIGGCLLSYGSQPDARLFSRPKVYAGEEELYFTAQDQESNSSAPVEGALLGLKRAVEEVKGLASVVEEAPAELPVLALIDGSLVLWGLAGRGYQPFIRDEILKAGLLPALDRLRGMSANRALAVAAYVSLPQSTDVVNTLRLYLCSSDTTECSRQCNSHRSARTPCDMVNGFLDRHLFEELLQPGERSSLFVTSSSVSRDYYGPHQVHFYYIHTGDEIARVEVPQWVAENESALSLSHTLILDQCRRGQGYPAAISEAHEQAVVTGQDRETFKQLLDGVLFRKRLPVYTSEKARSKRTRWL